jgi:hypothetical protein
MFTADFLALVVALALCVAAVAWSLDFYFWWADVKRPNTKLQTRVPRELE